MSDLLTLAQGWFRKADSDLNTLRLVVDSAGPMTRPVIMHNKP